MRTSSAFECFNAFLKLGLTSFGGPVAHIGYFRTEFVSRRNWLSEERFAELLAICQFLPGPASSQLGFAIGLQRAGFAGAMAAFIAFTLPSLAMLLSFAHFTRYFESTTGQQIVAALKLVAVVIVADAILGMSKKFCTDRTHQSIAIFSATVLLISSSALLHVVVIAVAFLVGAVMNPTVQGHAFNSSASKYPVHKMSLFLGIFLLLLVGLPVLSSYSPELAIANLFYQAGALVFGGGHVVLPLLEASVVDSGLVSNDLFMAGYGAAQAVPGPLFSFAGYLGFNLESHSNPWLMMLVATAFIFLPGFLLLTAILPVWNNLSQNLILAAGLSGANAAVVGLLIAAFYDPVITSGIESKVDAAIGLLGFLIITTLKKSALWLVAWCIAAKLASGLL